MESSSLTNFKFGKDVYFYVEGRCQLLWKVWIDGRWLDELPFLNFLLILMAAKWISLVIWKEGLGMSML